MTLFKGENVKCECCELEVPEKFASPVVNAYGIAQGARCRICNEHQGNPVKMAQDHEYEVRVRWGEAVDELHATQDRAEEYERRMKAALKSRESVLRAFERVGVYHQRTTHGCSCGDPDCETLPIVEDDWINQLIRNMHKRW